MIVDFISLFGCRNNWKTGVLKLLVDANLVLKQSKYKTWVENLLNVGEGKQVFKLLGSKGDFLGHMQTVWNNDELFLRNG